MKKIFFILCTILLWSCSDESEPSALPNEYCYQVTLNCFCVNRGPHNLHIRNGKVLKYEDAEGQSSRDSMFINSLRIEELTDRVEGILSGEVFSQQVEYHPVYGFPSSVFIDIDAGIADEEWGYEITNFEVK